VFEISAGKSQDGKALKKGRAFYQLGNLEPPKPLIPNYKNAFFANSKVENADAGMRVTKGGATFLGELSFQNAKVAVFEQTAYFDKKAKFLVQDSSIFKEKVYFKEGADFHGVAVFEDSAYFLKDADFMKSSEFNGFARFDKKVHFDKENAIFKASARFEDMAEIFACGKFYGETYFKKSVKLQNCAPEFYHRVGFDGGATGKIDLSGQMMESKKDADGIAYDVFINSKFEAPGPNGGINGTGVTGHNAYLSDHFNQADVARCKNFNPAPSRSNTYNTTVTVDSSFKMKIGDVMHSPDANSRKDPEITAGLKPIYDVAASYSPDGPVIHPDGTVVIHKAEKVITSNGSKFDINKLKSEYAKAVANTSSLYDGKYMVIEVTTMISPPDSDPGIFDANIIYIIKAGGTFDMGSKFYSNSPNSTTNTLIYVGAGKAKLEQFGTSGDFRGFIYIDKDNDLGPHDNNSLKFPGSGKIIGAVHSFSTQKLGWNTGVPGYSIPIEFSIEVLSGFASLYPKSALTPGTPDPEEEKITINAPSLDVTPIGFYFD
jgi:hypothetical protein